MSDLLIKGMKMPDNCTLCEIIPRCSYCEGYNDVCPFKPNNVDEEWDFSEGIFPTSRPDWCPLVEIPQHGDLIDRNALKTSIIKKLAVRSEENLLPSEMVLMAEIMTAPTIIEAEDGT